MRTELIVLVVLVLAIAGLGTTAYVQHVKLGAAQAAYDNAKSAHDKDVAAANAATTAWKSAYDGLATDRAHQSDLIAQGQQAAKDAAAGTASALAEFKKAMTARPNACYNQPAGADIDALLAR